MKRSSLIILGGILAIILLMGTFSAGLVVGRFALPGGNFSLVESPIEQDTISDQTGERQTIEVRSTEEETTGQSDASQDSPTPKPTTESVAPTEDLEDLFEPFWETWDIVHDQFVDQPVNDEEMMRGAIEGMLGSLDDPHTSYMDPSEFQQANIPLAGEYEGIGAWVDPNREYLTIISPMPGSPAEEAGLEPGDEIIAVDGEDMTGVDGNLVIRRVLGEAGTQVVLTIRREGAPEPFDVTITRARITINSVEYHMLEDNIGYINLLRFADETHDELQNALKDLLEEDPVGLVIDLRNNGGGFLNSAIEVTSEFISDEVILYEDYGNGVRDTHEAIPGGLATEVPIIVLVNEGTASASEIFAGAIQDHDRGSLVGVTTFGKGSVQNWIPLADDEGAVRVTIARWLTPDERQISQVGLEPDYIIGVLTEADIEAGLDAESLGLEPDQVVVVSEEDLSDGQDPQLDKAVEVLLQGIGG